MKNKICFFNSEMTWGGGEKWHYETAEEFLSKGYDVTIVGNIDSEIIKKSKMNKIQTSEFKISNRSFLNVFLLIKLIRYFRKKKYDIVIANLPIDMKLLAIISFFVKIPKKIYRRGSAIPIKKTFLNNFLLLKGIDIILVNSYETKKTVVEKLKSQAIDSKIKVIHNFFDTSKYNLIIENVKRANQYQIIIGNLARLSKQKGQNNFIDIAKILNKDKINYKIIIAGVGELEEDLKNEIKENKLEENIKLLGFCDNVSEFFLNIDIFVFPSLWEGFGYSLVEAMYFNKPIVAYDISSNKEILGDYKYSTLVELGDNLSFANAIIEYSKKLEDVNKSNFGTKNVIERFSKEKVIKDIENMLNT